MMSSLVSIMVIIKLTLGMIKLVKIMFKIKVILKVLKLGVLLI